MANFDPNGRMSVVEVATIFISKKTPQVLATLAATVGAFSMGAVEGWTSPALPNLEESGKLGELTTDEYSNIASFALLAALFSGPPTGLLIQKFGRKTTMLGLAFPFVLGWLLVAFAQNLPMMYVGRVLTGFCAGACSLAVPVYIGETAEDSVRGMLGSGFQLMVTCGNLFVYLVGTFVSWQWLAIICAFVPVVGLILMILVPPSPRYLLSVGREAEASKALVWLRGAVSSKQVEFELAQMQQSIDTAKEEQASFRDIVKPEIYKPLAVMLGIMFFQQLSGIEAVLVYTVDIFIDAGSKIDPNLSTIIVGTLQVISTCISTILVDRWGRRILLLISAVFMSIAMIVLGTFFYLKEQNPDTAEQISWLPLVSLMTYIVAFAFGFGPVAWMMTPEIIPNKAIGIGSATCTSANWTLAFLASRFFKPLSLTVGMHWVFAGFATFSMVATAFVFYFVPETMGKSLDEIQEHFKSSPKKLNRSTSQNSDHNIINNIYEQTITSTVSDTNRNSIINHIYEIDHRPTVQFQQNV